MNPLLELFGVFFKIGLFGYGGGYAVISLLQHEVVRHGWMDQGRFVDMIAIAQSTPGPIAINIATYVGYEQAGVPGALVATLAVVLPGAILMVLLAVSFLRAYKRPAAQAMLRGLRPAVVGLVAAAAWRIGQVAVVDWRSAAIMLASCGLIVWKGLRPIPLVLGSAIAGMLFF